jgi:hypothetical protein
MKTPTFLCTLIACALALASSRAQEFLKPAYPSEEAQKAWQAGNYLAPLVEFRNKRDELIGAKGSSNKGSNLPLRGIYLQTYSGFSAEVSNYREAIEVFDSYAAAASAPPGDIEAQRRALSDATPVEATKVILELAGKQQAVFINEAHHIPQHRALTLRLLRDLWRKGFRYFAAETLDFRDKELQARKYPLIGKSGYYLNEPVYADVIRTALKLGYQVIPYEFEEEAVPASDAQLNRQQQRDKGQARNLYERVFKQDPKARIVVHAGYAHIYEKQRGGWSPMAMYFREFTGIDPLTIDQTEMTEHSAPQFENAVYKDALARWEFTQPTLVRTPANEYFVGGNVKGLVDLQVFSPRSDYRGGRPAWLQLGGLRTAQRIVISDLKQGFPYLVQAVLTSEGAEAIPMDQIEVQAPGASVTLLLPKGEFVIRIKDRTGAVLRSSSLKVK